MTSSQEKGLHITYKNIGEIPLEAINRFKKDNPEFSSLPVTYAGRLDPMAEGVLILLSGDKVKEKDKYLGLPKTYEFEILCGFNTDTLDLLGLVVGRFSSLKVNEEEIQKYLVKSIGKFEQKYPAYSSKPVEGKPLFQWSREGRISEVIIPKHEVEIFEASFISRRSISKEDLLKEINSKVALVNGDFRQKEILEKWIDVLKNTIQTEFIVDKIELKVSSGFYVRQFVSDLSENFGAVGTTFHIKRLQIGDYTLAENKE